MNLENTKDVVAKRFGKTHAEACAFFGINPQHMTENRWPFGVHVRGNSDASQTVEIGFKEYVKLIQFTIGHYPSCCGSKLFHSFKVDPRVSQEALDEIMQAFVKDNEHDRHGLFGTSRRIEVVMVERRPAAGRDPLAEVEPVENPNIEYKQLWNFFHKYAKRVRTRLEINANTGNVLHNMEVIV